MNHKLSYIVAVWLLLAGCAAPTGTGSQPKPGKGLAEYRQLTRDAQRAVAVTMDSLNALDAPCKPGLEPHPAIKGFDESLRKLELTSIKTRARAEAILMRGDAYFEEWREQMGKGSNQAPSVVEQDRYVRLLQRFTTVRERSGTVRTEFRPFMARVREFRAALGESPCPAENASLRSRLGALKGSGQRVLDSLEGVSNSLNDAETELRASAPARK